MKRFWHMHKKRIHQVIIWSIMAIFFIFVIPLCINFVYDIPASFSVLAVSWEAKDALAFYGTLLSASATIYVLRQTIKFTINNQKAERKLSIKPYLQTIDYKCNYSQFEVLMSEKNIIIVDINKDIITYQGTPPYCINNTNNQVNVNLVEDEDLGFNIDINTGLLDSFLYYEITNCGAGNAVSVEMRLNDKEVLKNFCVTTTASKKFIFVFRENLLNDKDEYKFNIKLNYTDVSSLGTYYQEESILIKREKNQSIKIIQLSKDLLTKPKEMYRENGR